MCDCATYDEGEEVFISSRATFMSEFVEILKSSNYGLHDGSVLKNDSSTV
jgi:hypothetical protein